MAVEWRGSWGFNELVDTTTGVTHAVVASKMSGWDARVYSKGDFAPDVSMTFKTNERQEALLWAQTTYQMLSAEG